MIAVSLTTPVFLTSRNIGNVFSQTSVIAVVALGLQSIKNAGIKPGRIILVGFDALPDEVAQIKSGNETGRASSPSW